MATGLPDLVDCARLAQDAAKLQRVYELGDLPRLKDFLAEPRGTLRAKFAFTALASGLPGAEVAVEASPLLVCQRCMQGTEARVSGGSGIEFTASRESDAAVSEREFFAMENGHVSLRDLAEEELLLALPLAPACSAPARCGKAPAIHREAAAEHDAPPAVQETVRPFGALRDLMKKQDRT